MARVIAAGSARSKQAACLIAACMFLTCLWAFGQEDYIGLRRDGLNEYLSGHYPQAEVLLEKAIDAAQKANNQFEVALSYSALGDVDHEEARFAEAEQLYRKGISILLHQPGRGHALAIMWRHLASALIAETQYGQALAALDQASKLVKANKLVEPQLNAEILNGRGVIYFYRGKLGRAKTLFERAVELTPVAAEAGDLTMEDILNNLARTYQRGAQYAKAEETYKRALKLAEIRLGTSHPDLVVAVTNLGSLYTDLGRYREAEDQFQRALGILEHSTTSLNEWRLLEALHGLAKTYIRENDQGRAEPVLRRSAEIARRNLNQIFLIPEILEVLDDYSKVLRDLKDPEDADRLHAEAQRIRASTAFTVEVNPKPTVR